MMDRLADLAAITLRRLDPETAHNWTIRSLSRLQPLAASATGAVGSNPALRIEIGALSLPNPVGLAAGFDKGAEVPDAMLGFGFGFVECGTVTPQPQPGNPRPRLFRLSRDRAVINRFGFNSEGLDAVASRLAGRRGRPGVVGANLGANKTSDDKSADYVAGLRRLWGLADYFTINVSSPNTPGLRDLQGEAALVDLLDRLVETRAELAAAAPSAAPLFLKVAPDLDAEGVSVVARAALGRVDALIVSNTTTARPPSLMSPDAGEAGGLSGRPLFAPSTERLAAFRRATRGALPLIGVGGVEDAATAYAKIRAGASAVQLYTALVYEGPSLVGRIVRGLAERLRSDGFERLADAIGADVPI